MSAAGPREPLLGARWRRPAATLAVLGGLVWLALAIATYHRRYVLFDRAAFRVLPEHISTRIANGLLQFTEPAVSVMLLVFVVVFSLSRRRWDLAALAVLGPVLGTVLASYVMKPIVHRTLFDGTVGSYPSGHETGVACTGVVVALAFGRLRLGWRTRTALLTVLVVWAVVAAVGLTRYYYHYATDTIGAAGWSLALVLGLAFAADRWWPAVDRSAGRAAPDRPARRGPEVHRPRPPARRPSPGARRPSPNGRPDRPHPVSPPARSPAHSPTNSPGVPDPARTVPAA